MQSAKLKCRRDVEIAKRIKKQHREYSKMHGKDIPRRNTLNMHVRTTPQQQVCVFPSSKTNNQIIYRT